MYIGGQHFAHFLGAQVVVVVRKEQPGFLLVAHKAIDLLQKVPALHSDAHVGNGSKDLLMVLFGIVQHLLYSFLFQIQLQCNGVTVGKDLIPFFLQQAGEGSGVRPLGNGCVHIAVVVKDGQPGAHAVRHTQDVAGVHLMIFQLVDHILSHAGVVHQTDKGRTQLYIGDILHHIAAHTAMHLFNAPGVASAGNVGRQGIPLDIHKNSSDDYDAHKR